MYATIMKNFLIRFVEKGKYCEWNIKLDHFQLITEREFSLHCKVIICTTANQKDTKGF